MHQFWSRIGKTPPPSHLLMDSSVCSATNHDQLICQLGIVIALTYFLIKGLPVWLFDLETPNL